MKPSDYPDEIRAFLQAERRNASSAAHAFADACTRGDVEALYKAADRINCTPDGWRLAFLKIGRARSVSADIQRAFLLVWIETKRLPLDVGHRPTLASALRLLMPGNYEGPPLKLYRGATWLERQRRLYGFSWTADRNVAQKVAENWRQLEDGSVVLQTIVPPEAVLLIRKAEDYYDEGEVVVDPFRLRRIEVAERLTARAALRPRAVH